MDTDLTVTLSQGSRSLELSGVWQVQAGAEGLDDGQVELLTDSAPAVYGEFPTGLSIPARDVFLPVGLWADTGTAWRSARRVLRTVANPLVGPTTITVSQGDGTSRSIEGWHVPEQSAAWAEDTWSAAGWQKFGLTFRCPSPWWRVPGEIAPAPWVNTTPPGFFVVPFFPVRVGSSQILGNGVTVTNPGDAPTWPTWVIEGALGTVTATNITTGRAWTVDLSTAVSPVTIVTDPKLSSVSAPGYPDLFNLVAAPFDLWPFEPGAQQVRVIVTGADDTTTITAVADGLYLGAVV